MDFINTNVRKGLDKDENNISTLFADIATNIRNFPIKVPESDDTGRINRALSSMVDGQILYFPKGTYKISSKITISKRIEIVGENYYSTIIQNNGSDDGILLNYERANIKNIMIQGTSSSKSGVVVGHESCNLIDVFLSANGKHGIKILPNVWIVNIERCYLFNNTQSGIYAVSGGGNGQINAINIKNSHTWLNGEHGIYLGGTTVVNIKDNVIENNSKSGIFVSTKKFNITNLNIEDNYFEGNKNGHISFDLYPSLGYRVYSCRVNGNYLYLNANQVNANINSIINATTDTIYDGVVSFIFEKGNTVFTDTLAHVDLGNSIYQDGQSKIESNLPTSDFSLSYKNLGTCGVNNNQKTFVINGYFFCKGITYKDPAMSNNIISTLETIKACYPIQLPSGKQFIKAGVVIISDSTNYNVTFTILKRNACTGVSFSNVVSSTILNKSGTRYIETPDIQTLDSPNNGRIMANEEYYLQLQFVNSGGGTNFQVQNPIITYVE
ncbi:right-handed parallel beta-helix repeat-containing protein [Neobacillus sp. M.A.Huq-85]